MKPVRVLHVSAAGVYGGNEEHLRTLFTHLDPSRVETHLAAPPGSSLFAKAKAMDIPVYPLEIRGGTDFKALMRLDRLMVETGIRLLHTHNRWEDGLGAALTFHPNLIWMTTLHDRLNMDQEGNRVRTWKARLYHRMLRRARIVMVNSRTTAADAIAEAGLDKGRVLPITNGQDLGRLSGVKADASGLPEGACRVGLFARVRGTAIQKKGVPEFIQAAAAVLKQGGDAVFFLMGADAGAIAEADRLAGEAGLPSGRWKALPFAGDARPAMAAVDVLVCPSRFEGLPRSLMEGMGLGRAVVGTEVDGIGEIIQDGTSGLLVPPRDPSALAAAILKLVADPDLRARLGVAAARRVREAYGAAKMAREHESAYLAIMPPA